ncbi:hypothetical protein NVP1031O_019 [Vibrio phage 1.031.O._10N.261.46.F8]|nr:hypothetical protein NVP1031O_019 [Vibrio phage 1.031.O._10N.261.46.F8]
MSSVTIVTQATSEHYESRLKRLLDTWKSINIDSKVAALKILLMGDFDVDTIKSEYPTVEFIHGELMPVNKARDLVSQDVDSEFIMFIDDDFYVEPELELSLHHARAIMDHHQDLATLTFCDKSRKSLRLDGLEDTTQYVIAGIDQFFWTCDGIMTRNAIWSASLNTYLVGTEVSTMFEEALISRIPQVLMNKLVGVYRSEGIHHYRARGVVPRTFVEPEYNLKGVIEATGGCGKDLPSAVRTTLSSKYEELDVTGCYQELGDRIPNSPSAIWITARHARHPKN